MNRRRSGQLLASSIALAAFGGSLWASHTSAIPEFRVYDGYYMMAGATVAVGLVGLLAWHWRREWSLLAIALATVIGSVTPLAISALRHNIPLMARLRGSWMLAGADIVGPALVVGFLALWFAVRDYRDQPRSGTGSAAG